MPLTNVDPQIELERLRVEVRALRHELANVKREASGASDSRIGVPSSKDALMRSLKEALDVNRRQMEGIARVHARFLPARFPVLAGLEIAARCRPSTDIGGDFYDAIELADGRVAITIADVSGHGPIAAVTMGITRSLLRVALLEVKPEEGPSAVLLRLAQWTGMLLEDDQFATMWLGIWDPATEKLTFARAAHPQAVLWRADGNPEFLMTAGTIPVGLAGIDPIPAPEDEVELGLGDRVFLYTDGWNETPASDGSVLEGQRFLEFLDNAYGAPIDQVPSILFMEFERHAANARIRDDVSLVVFGRQS